MDYRIPHNLLVVTSACPTAHRAWRKDIRPEEMIDIYLDKYTRYLDCPKGKIVAIESLFCWITGGRMGGRFLSSYTSHEHWLGIERRMTNDNSAQLLGRDPIISFDEYRRQAIRALREIIRNYRKTVRKYARAI